MNEIAPTTPASNESTPFMLRFALDYLNEEHEKLLAMALALAHELEPQDPKNPEDTDNLTAWHLAEVLCERLSDKGFSNSISQMVLGKQGVKSA